MNDKERSKVLEGIKDFLPAYKVCVDGKAHKFKAVRTTNYLFSFLNRTQVMCSGCGEVKWL